MTTTNILADISLRIADGVELSDQEWLAVAAEASTEELLRLADAVRWKLHPEPIVTYVVDRNVNYTNICNAVCTFCAFYRKPGSPEGYVLPNEDIFEQVQEMFDLGGSGVLMQGGLHPDLPLQYYETLLGELRSRFPGIYLHCFSPPEIVNLARLSGLPIAAVLQRLKDAGLDSIPGGGAEILVDAFRKRRATKCTGLEWIEVMETAHSLGIPSTATMMFGMGERAEHRIGHLRMIKDAQRRTGGFYAFICWTFQPDNTPLGRAFPDRVPADEFLRWFAISRLYLDNIPNHQVSWLTQGLDVGRRALHGGANDLGSIMIEENVISAAGARHRATEEMLRKAILDEGFRPVRRNARYEILDRNLVI
jgi:cyclic dehypoxanthinyl futalosine synthase